MQDFILISKLLITSEWIINKLHEHNYIVTYVDQKIIQGHYHNNNNLIQIMTNQYIIENLYEDDQVNTLYDFSMNPYFTIFYYDDINDGYRLYKIAMKVDNILIDNELFLFSKEQLDSLIKDFNDWHKHFIVG